MLPFNHKVREQKREENIDNILSSASAQDQANFSFSPHTSHTSLCEQLLPHTVGWENFFLREILELRTLSPTQQEKLKKIASRYEKEKSTRRICRYCQSRAQIIDEYSYFCRNCGNCLNLGWFQEVSRQSLKLCSRLMKHNAL